MSCRRLCKLRGYGVANGRINYDRNYVCSVCGVKFPHQDAIETELCPRCPCCKSKVRTASIVVGQIERKYVIELDV